MENNMRTRATGGLDPRQMPAYQGGADQNEAFLRCPECGSEHFTQRPARD